MAKRTIVIKADDGQQKLEITAKLKLEGLTIGEQESVVSQATRSIVASISHHAICFTDFGVDNIKIG